MAAPVNLDDLSGFLGEVVGDTRTVKDPWGFGIEAVIGNTKDEGWEKFDLDRINELPVLQNQRVAQAEFATADAEQAIPGFRAPRKKTSAEKVMRFRKQLAAKTDLQTAVETIRAQKPGIAEHLVKAMTFRGAEVFSRAGQQFDLSTAAGVLAFMDHEAWRTAAGKVAIPPFETKDGELVLDTEGQPVPNRFGGENMGDAVAMWVLEEAGQVAEFVQKKKAANQGESAATSNGPIESGSATPSPSAEG